MSSTFSLRDIVRAELNATDAADPGAIAATVMASLDPSDYADALAQTMRLFVRQVISEQRGTGSPSNVRPIIPSTSWKGQGIRDGWQKHLEDRLHVDGTWKFLRVCTADDLRLVASERQQKAEQNAAWARRYRAYASEIEAAGVETFGDLDAAAQMRLLGGAA